MENNEEFEMEDIQNQVIFEFSKTLEMFRLTPTEARLLATLYINKYPMTLDEMGLALGKSKTSMSTSIRSLLEENLVERVWKKGERKDYYQARENLFKKIIQSYLEKWFDLIDSQKQSLSELQSYIQTINGQENQNNLWSLQERLKEIVNFHLIIEDMYRKY
jgi:HTH-type transcriptional regulator, osmoprotectant uptake regulator